MGSQETVRVRPRSQSPPLPFPAPARVTGLEEAMELDASHPGLPLFGSGEPQQSSSGSRWSSNASQPEASSAVQLYLRSPSVSSSPAASPRVRTLSSESVQRVERREQRSRSSTPSDTDGAGPLGGRRRRSHTPADPASPLIADVQMARSRILISRTHTLYPPPSVAMPYRSAALGFRVVFHPLSQTRIKDAEITIRFLSPMGEPHAVKQSHTVGGGLTLGYDAFANLSISASTTRETSWTAHASVIGSGVETSTALFSLVENSASHAGLDPVMDMALILQLPSTTTSYFEAELTVEANVGKDSLSDVARRLLGSPRLYRLVFDGETEMGSLRIEQNAP